MIDYGTVYRYLLRMDVERKRERYGTTRAGKKSVRSSWMEWVRAETEENLLHVFRRVDIETLHIPGQSRLVVPNAARAKTLR